MPSSSRASSVIRSGVQGGSITTLTSTSLTSSSSPSKLLALGDQLRASRTHRAGQSHLDVDFLLAVFASFFKIDNIDQSEVDNVDEQFWVDDFF